MEPASTRRLPKVDLLDAGSTRQEGVPVEVGVGDVSFHSFVQRVVGALLAGVRGLLDRHPTFARHAGHFLPQVGAGDPAEATWLNACQPLARRAWDAAETPMRLVVSYGRAAVSR